MAAHAVPLPIALVLFEAMVDSILEHGRWLFAVQAGSQAAYDDALAEWSRELLGGDPCRNEAAAMGELEWALSGFARGIRSVAARRARLWRLRRLVR